MEEATYDMNEIYFYFEKIKKINEELRIKDKMIKNQYLQLKEKNSELFNEKKLLEAKQKKLSLRESCHKTEKKNLLNEMILLKEESEKNKQLYIENCELDQLYKALEVQEEHLRNENIVLQEKIECISKANINLPKTINKNKKSFFKNLLQKPKNIAKSEAIKTIHKSVTTFDDDDCFLIHESNEVLERCLQDLRKQNQIYIEKLS